jgi:hypothetical protein
MAEKLRSQTMVDYRTGINELEHDRDGAPDESLPRASHHHYCDYDMSDKHSESSIGSFKSVDTITKTIVTRIVDDKWYDKSTAAYFTSEQTRNAQTVSWK